MFISLLLALAITPAAQDVSPQKLFESGKYQAVVDAVRKREDAPPDQIYLRALAHRWTSQHLPMMVEAHDYDAVIGEVHDQLGRAGWELHREPASWMLRFPTEVLTFIAGGSVESLVAERLTTLRAPELEVTLHPADLVVQGKEADVVHARATLAERLAFSRAHLTWTEEGNELEDRIRSIESLLTVTGGDVVYAAGPFAGPPAAPEPLPAASPAWSPVNHFGGFRPINGRAAK